MNKKGRIGLIELDTTTLPKWLLYPLVILVCFTLLVVVLFFSVVIYSCIKGNCNGYYGVPVWFGYHPMGPMIMGSSFQTSSQECYLNGAPINCSEISTGEVLKKNG